jgi:AcrR family transcriptional regulator
METAQMAHLSQKRKTPELKRLFLKSYASSSYCISSACEEIGVGRRTFYNWLEKDAGFKVAFEDLGESRLDAIEKAIYKRGVEDEDTTALIFLAKTLCKGRGYLEGARIATVDRSPVLARVLDDLLAGTTTIERAALILTKEGLPLPEAIKTLLAKVTPPEPLDDGPAFNADPAEMDERYRNAIEKCAHQRAVFVPERIAEVEEIKRGLREHEAFLPQEMEG